MRYSAGILWHSSPTNTRIICRSTQCFWICLCTRWAFT